jgi:TPP-dependent pyruvate/acetoin dehydrogenase alpha subunit
MAKVEELAPAAHASLNDDIGEQTRLRMYRMQVEIREAEQRAFDLFLQNLVKGTSHLSLGQEAVAFRSAPIAATPTRWRAALNSRKCWAN